MKIGNPSDNPTVAAPATPTPARSGPGELPRSPVPGPQPLPPPAEASATVALSSEATQLMSSKKAVAGDFDTEKVERIAQAISDGKFQINAPVIADKLLANAREVLGKATQ